MISAAAAFPQKFGCEFWAGSGKDQFAAIDENGDGAVSFDEWLGFAYSHYKSQALDVAFDKLDKETFVKDCKNVGDTSSDAYRKIYWFSWKCFQVPAAIVCINISCLSLSPRLLTRTGTARCPTQNSGP